MIKAELLQDAPDCELFLNATGDSIGHTLLRVLQGSNTLIKRLITDSNWVLQEKHNGDRRIVQKNGDGTVLDYNRNGGRGKGLPDSVRAVLQAHPMYQFIIDTELVEQRIFVFDTLYYGDEAVVGKSYSYREALYHAQFSGFDGTTHRDGYGHIVCVESARTPEQKIALIQRLAAEFAEGFVAKDLRAPYRPSENNQRWNYRYKFIKELDAVVIGDSTKRVDGKLRDSVRLGCFNQRGILKDICGATKKANLPLLPGTVVKLRYLYGTGTLDVVQPRIVGTRDDKAPQLCTLDQIIVNKNWKSWGKP